MTCPTRRSTNLTEDAFLLNDTDYKLDHADNFETDTDSPESSDDEDYWAFSRDRTQPSQFEMRQVFLCADEHSSQEGVIYPTMFGDIPATASPDAGIFSAAFDMDCDMEIREYHPIPTKMKKGWCISSNDSTRLWLRLDEKRLFWYAHSDEAMCLGLIDFDFVPCKVEQVAFEDKAMETPIACCAAPRDGGNSCRQHAFRVLGLFQKKYLEFMVEDEHAAREWACAVSIHIAASEQQYPDRYVAGPTASPGNCWFSVPFLTLRDFTDLTRTGDLLLFRTKCMWSKLYRTAWQCRYDHVAMVIKTKDRKVALLEVSGREALELTRISQFIGNGFPAMYHEIALRRVSFHRTAERLKLLQKYVQKRVGKKLLVTKLRDGGFVKGEDGQMCAYMLVEAYKNMDLLPRSLTDVTFEVNNFAGRVPSVVFKHGCAILPDYYPIKFPDCAGS